jgi:ferredoxin
VKIVIDPAACSGNGRCYSLVPDLFTDDERGYGQVIGDGTITDSQLEAAQRAVRACPESAISIE